MASRTPERLLQPVLPRRDFLRFSPAIPFAATPRRARSSPAGEAETLREFLARRMYTREEVATFLDPAQPNWAKFDPVLGYSLRSSVVKDGVDGSRTIGTYLDTGERRRVNYAGVPCRINAYGDSFTQCAQVSDGETWEEYLAAHLGEPIRNFGVGGYGVYQAYRRMLREEATPSGAEYLILNIWGIDDHLRSVDAWRWLRFATWFRAYPGHLHMVHGNPWAHIRIDPDTGAAVERDNPYSSPEAMYRLADAEHVYEHFKDDVIVKLIYAERYGTGMQFDELEGLARLFAVAPEFDSREAVARTAEAIHIQYALRTSMHVVAKARAFAQQRAKKLLVFLSYDNTSVVRACEGGARQDQRFVDYLRDNRIPFVDVLAKHVEDYRTFRLTPREYANRYYIGHYKPQGNHFFAFAVKDSVVEWLEPKPVTYRKGSETIPV
jgi:hypothetical protein